MHMHACMHGTPRWPHAHSVGRCTSSLCVGDLFWWVGEWVGQPTHRVEALIRMPNCGELQCERHTHRIGADVHVYACVWVAHSIT
jgi:hypothetical protein